MPKPFAVLRYLVEHAGRLVTQDELLTAIWPETYVQPEVLRRYILEIRRVLGDKAEKPRFVETLPKRGYQFIAPVTDVNAAGPADDVANPKTKLVGRESAFTDLHAHLKNAQRGQRQLVFVMGEPGIGKTSLVDAFQHVSSGIPDVSVARGQSLEGFAGKEAYYPVFEALGQLVRGPAKTLVINSLATHAPTWMVQFPSLVKAEQQASLQREILGATPERMVRELCEALEVISQSVTLVLILEDLHWADDSTLDLISAIARRRESAKLYLVGTIRPADLILSESPLKALKQDLVLHRLSDEVRLERLHESDVADYLAAEFSGGDLPRGLATVIHRHSEGNPLFMIAMLDHLAKQGVLSHEDGRWKLTTSLDRVDPGVPETLRQMLELQLQHLSEAEQELLKCASVGGQHFTAWAVATMLKRDPSTVEQACAALAERQQFLKSSGTRELPNGQQTPQYEFRHSLYREVLQRRLNPAQRVSFHRSLAEGLESLGAQIKPEMAAKIALHFEEGRDYERAIRYLLLTAQNARHRYAHREAITVLEHARELVGRIAGERAQKLEFQILGKIGDTYYSLGDMTRSVETYQSMATSAAEAGLLAAEANALMRLAYPASFLDPDRCIAACERAAHIGAMTRDPALKAQASLLAACWRILVDGWQEAQIQACAAAIATLRRLDSDLPPHDQILYSKVQIYHSDYTEAFKNADGALLKLTEVDEPWDHAAALSAKAVALTYMGRLGEAHNTLTAGMKLMEKNDSELVKKDENASWLGILRGTLVWLHWQAYDFAGIRELSKQQAECSACNISPKARLRTAILQGFTDLTIGEYDRAAQCFQEVLDHFTRRTVLHWYWGTLARLGLSETWLASGNLAKANIEADALEQAVSVCGDSYIKALAWETRARLALAEGKQEKAEQYILKGLETIASVDVPLAAWRVHAAAWEVYRETDRARSNTHRASAQDIIAQIADSLDEVESLRESFLSAQDVRHILSDEPTQRKTARVG